MPNQIIWEEKGVISSYTGLFSPETHIEGLGQLFGDKRIDNISYIIGDYTGVNGELLTEIHVEYPVAVATGAAMYVKNIKLALVATDDKIINLCVHFIELSTQINPTWEMKMFEDLKTARKWIDSKG